MRPSGAAVQAIDRTGVHGDPKVAAGATQPSRHTFATTRGAPATPRPFAHNAAAPPPATSWLLNPMITGVAMAFSPVFAVPDGPRLRGLHIISTRRLRSH
ncbi:hypothetical protein NKH18_17615 [Streptomyces sp. M10(2022)]